MKIIAKLDNGNLLAEVPANTELRLATLRTLCGDILAVVGEISGGGEVAPYPNTEARIGNCDAPDTTTVEKPQPALKATAAKPVAKAAKVAKPAQQGAPNKPINWKEDLVAIMTGKDQMRVKDIIAAYAGSKGLAVDKAMVKAIGQCLPSNKDVFENCGRGVYRLIAPTAAVPKAKAADDGASVEEAELMHADPATLTDEQLARRMQVVKRLGRNDQDARMEFIRRKARA